MDNIVIWICILFVALVRGDQPAIDYIADNLQVEYDVISNFRDSSKGAPISEIEIRLKNGGDDDITITGWSIYLCSIRLLEPEHLFDDPDAVFDVTSGVSLEHVDGCLHRFNMTSQFRGIPSGDVISMRLSSSDWTVSRTDVMPNWYVVSEGLEPRTLASTTGESLDFVGAFEREEQYKRREYDQYTPYTAEDRYNLYADVDDLGAPEPILPTPAHLTTGTPATLHIRTGDWVVVASDANLTVPARYLAEKLNCDVVHSPPISLFIELHIGEVKDPNGNVLGAESYQLHVDIEARQIIITGHDRAGVMHGVQSLLSLEDGKGEVPDVVVVDYPRFEYRGMHVDVGRNFLPKASVLQLLEVMSMYKMNKFHFHLTDDEGWRLEIPGLEELTEVGGRRCHDLSERSCLLSQLGSGPGSNNFGSGFYTVDDYREILQYAEDRNIEVIPEFDMPGHGHAPIRAMEARYAAYIDSDPARATEFLLSDPEDESHSVSIQYFRSNAFNPCMNSSYDFVRKIVQEVKAMHADIQPLKIFHFGGDEQPHGTWVGSPACHAFLGTPNVTEQQAKDLKAHFVIEVGKVVYEEGLDLAGWEDGLMHNAEPFNRSAFQQDHVYGYPWNNIWEWGGGDRAYILANNGYDVVLSHATDLYFDMPYEPDPEERGYYWATRFTDTRNTFNYMPERVYDNIYVDRFGNPLTKADVCNEQTPCEQLEESKKGNIRGMQGHLWSETQRTPAYFESMVYPRLLSVAERGWHRAAWEGREDEGEREAARDEDWARFANTLGHKELARLDQLGLEYRVPIPGARFVDGELEAIAQFPGLRVQYSTDEGSTWAEYRDGVDIEPDTTVLLNTRSARGLRVSRSTSLKSPPAEPPISTAVAASLPSTVLISLLALTVLLR